MTVKTDMKLIPCGDLQIGVPPEFEGDAYDALNLFRKDNWRGGYRAALLSAIKEFREEGNVRLRLALILDDFERGG